MLLCVLAACGIENLVRGQDSEIEDPVVVVETFEQAPHEKVDLLFVIDDTGSMAEEQAALSDSFVALVEAVDGLGLAYHFGVVTTASSGDEAGVLQGDPWIVTAASDDPVGDLAQAVEVGTSGVEEAGLAAMITALSEPVIDNENRGFRRADAALHVVVLSDDDDDSGDALGEDPVAAATAFLDEEALESGLSAQLSAVIGDVPGGCRGPGGEAFPGTRYAQVATNTGGAIGSICDADLDAVVETIVENAAHYPTEFELQAEPAEKPRVAIDGARQDGGWSLSGTTLSFETAPAAGSLIEVRYELREE